jgi:single-strand selective monofunctional uracil DNA glycosylase
MSLVRISRRLARAVDALRFAPPVACVYNPLVYARAPWEQYLARYGAGPKQVVLVGMNPGPFGMAQTGVPFGDVAMVRDWLGIRGGVVPPARQHPRRAVLGFECPRAEVSGTRLWGWARARFGTADRFAERFFVLNYCPLAFVEDSGRNRTPDKLPHEEREPLLAACDEALAAMLAELSPRHVVGVGRFAEQRVRGLAPASAVVGCIPHPSPASPAANRGWSELVDRELRTLGIEIDAPAQTIKTASN